MTAKAPNILIVMADQMAPAFLPIYGHALTRAPNMQALAKSGVVFDSAYCNSPLMLAVARLVHVRPAAVAHPRLRQCGGVRSRRSDLRALPENSAAIRLFYQEKCISAGRINCTGSKSG